MNKVLNLNKPAGITSHQAVAQVKRILGEKKAGHTGTLDPMATGVLLVCLGEATKISRFLLDMDKRYRARVKLGERTDTYDAAGTVIDRRDATGVTAADIIAVSRQYVGRISQVPPMYSAVKVNGQALHRLARKGIEVQRAARSVDIYEITVRSVDLPYFDMDVYCSKGTYIRSLCDDMGLALGPGAHLAALERTGIGYFGVADSVTPDELREQGLSGIKRCLYEIDEALADMPQVILDEVSAGKARHGVAIRVGEDSAPAHAAFVRLKDSTGLLLGIGRPAGEVVRVERLLNL